MAIPESQLETWSKQGSVSQSSATYDTVKTALSTSDAPYAGRSYSIFLQGSYGNDTNIYADSDVDVVIATDSIYYYDLSNLDESDRSAFTTAASSDPYTQAHFRAEVETQLRRKFGSSVKPGKKAILVEGTGSRRDADVLPAAQYRKFHQFRNVYNQNYTEGICFWSTDGVQIINYPKQHSANCTSKHQRTHSRFKPCVRILKNMRNTMIERGVLAPGIAPSYFLEGMLYNVPDNLFGQTYLGTIANSLNWIQNSNHEELVCANEMYYLINPSSPVTWRKEQLQTYLNTAIDFWNNWR